MWDVSAQSGSQLLPTGTVLRCRRWPWRVVGGQAGRHGAAVDVQALAPDAPPLATLLTPFDVIAAERAPDRWRTASRARLQRVIRSLDGAWSELPLAALSRLASTPWPHQLVPALALMRGRGVRVLVADEVGLGKTVSAGLAILELALRSLAARVLVLTPAGLRDQWQAELQRHLEIAADIIDAAALATLTREVPSGCSPWIGRGCRIVSMEFAKQPAVLSSLAQDVWDVLVIDEAHTVSGDSQRAAAVRALGLKARVILMLTATPHNGSPISFRHLLTLGALDDQDPVLWIRRDRVELGYPRPTQGRLWRLRSSPGEMALSQALHAYAAKVDATQRPEARLAMLVLKKRALSSPDAVLRSLERRLSHLSEAGDSLGSVPLLPFEIGELSSDDHSELAVLTSPGLLSIEAERAALRQLIDLASRATISATKYRALHRVVARTREAAVVFTEYRDTLHAVASRLSAVTSVVVLHGALDRRERRETIRQFTSGEARVLVATDAAAEGLNLQARCRFVVHLDLPWSPTTLTQRVGRVDRIGQSRPVRVWQLTGAGGHERTVVAALARRFRRIAADMGSPVPREWASAERGEAPVDDAGREFPRFEVSDLADVAAAIARSGVLIRTLRARAISPDRRRSRSTRRDVPWLRSRRARAIVGRGVLFLYDALPRSRGEARTHAAVHVSLHTWPPGSPATWLPALAARAAACVDSTVPDASRLRALARAREQGLLEQSEAETRRLHARWQPSLFDQRAAQIVDAARQTAGIRAAAHVQRLAELNADDVARRLEPVFALIVE